MNILMLLRNEFINDHRVKKEAESLASNGYQVTILAELCHNTIPKQGKFDNIAIIRIPVFSNLSNRFRAKGSQILNQEIKKKSLKSKLLITLKNNRIRRYLLSRKRDLIYFLAGSKFARTHKFDAVHAHDLDTLRLGHHISKKQRIPLVYDSHELWQSNNFVLQKNILSRKYLKRLEKRLITRAEKVIATTDSRAEVIQESFNIPRPEVIMNIPRYHEITKLNLLREELGIPADEKIVLYQGNISKNRGIYHLVDAVELLKKIRLVFLGAGDEVDNLKLLIIKKNLENKIHVLPAVLVEQLYKYTASADIGVATILNTCRSYYLSAPNKIFETMMAGIPLIMSDFPEYQKISSKADIGEIVNPEKPEEIARAIQKIIDSPERIIKIKENCKMLTREHYNWENEEKKLLNIYSQLFSN